MCWTEGEGSGGVRWDRREGSRGGEEDGGEEGRER